jgi:signal transduction histidine kinase
MYAEAAAAEGDPTAFVNNPWRTQAVRDTGLLDTAVEECFDRLTTLAVQLTGAAGGFLCLIDRDRNFLKSVAGAARALVGQAADPQPMVCHYTLLSKGALVVSDILEDPALRAIPHVGDFGFRAYLGVPLVTDRGHAIGTFSVIDAHPRPWSSQDIAVVTELATSAMREINLRSATQDALRHMSAALSPPQTQDNVLAAVAHDLRSPLSVIVLSAGLLSRGLPESRRDAVVDQIRGAAQHMSRLLDALVHPDRVQATKARLITPAALVRDVVADLQPIAEHRRIALVAEASEQLPPIHADHSGMMRVFGNLIGNAIKFSASGSQIRLEAVRIGEAIRFSVSDTGCGIASADLRQIFDPYWQADPSDGRGVGLGLAITKKIVTAHGGELGVTSAVGSGSTFYFTLPISQPTAPG